MTTPSPLVRHALAISVVLSLTLAAKADSPPSSEQPAEGQKDRSMTILAGTPDSKSTDTKAKSDSKPKYPPFAELLKGAKPIEGLIKLHRKNSKLYGELAPAQLNTDFIVIISIARGMGRTPLLGGYSWGFGDDWIWQFRKTDERIQIVRRNVRFRAAKGSPQERAVHLAYTDSVLFSLPIATMGPNGTIVVDLTSVFMSDLPQISQKLSGFSFSKDKSTWALLKGFKNNVEIQVAATYASSGTRSFDTVADSRGVTVNVHYSISKLPQTGYKPRMADDRVGYFLTAIKDYSKTSNDDRFVRYINRWDLRKAEPGASMSPPKTPIIFWLEKTVPFKYRQAIREGILAWNKAFERAGFVNAVEVRQQPNDAQWDPEDINYNTFRWITSSAGFAMGPSRVNPTTGQILDADIIFDADFLQYWKRDYEVFTPASVAALTGGALDFQSSRQQHEQLPALVHQKHGFSCACAQGMGRQLALGSVILAAEGAPASNEELDKLIMQGLRQVVMHEVGHTLGMRHNFKASTFLTLDELNNPQKAAEVGLAASVMDYLPMNTVAKDRPHSDYFSSTIGPYDYWIIEYGYKRFAANEEAELKKLASRCAEPALQYATDEDTRGFDPDPLTNRYDLGKNPIEFARRRVELINQIWPTIVDRVTGEGEGYQQARRAFNVLLSNHGRAMHFTARFIGGIYVHRDHKGDPNARPPYVVVEAAKQREAMVLLEQQVLGKTSYQFPAQLYNHLAHTNWLHWGTEIPNRIDFPVHEVILMWQDRILARLLSSTTLSRLVDSELKVPQDQDVFTAAELIEGLTAAVFRETEQLAEGNFTNRKPAIRALRRSLQRSYLRRLSDLAMGNTTAPEDCQSIVSAHQSHPRFL